MRAVIIDDERDGRDTLELLLQQHCPSVDIIGSAASFDSGLRLVENTVPDVLFLDIEMPLGSGFDLLDKFEEPPFETIFTTAYAQYAYRAFRVQAVDYLLKPIMPDDLIEAVRRAGERLVERGLYMARSADRRLHAGRIALRTAESIEFVQVQDIVRCKAESSYTVFFMANGESMMISKSLHESEEMLSDFRFLRVHNSHLINLSHIRRYVKSDGGYLIMSDNSKIILPRRRKDEMIRTITMALAGKG